MLLAPLSGQFPFLVRHKNNILVIKPNAPLTIVVMMLAEYRSSALDKTKRTFSATYWTTGTMKRCEKHANLLRIKPKPNHLISKMPRCIQQKLLYFFTFKKLDLGDECSGLDAVTYPFLVMPFLCLASPATVRSGQELEGSVCFVCVCVGRGVWLACNCVWPLAGPWLMQVWASEWTEVSAQWHMTCHG